MPTLLVLLLWSVLLHQVVQGGSAWSCGVRDTGKAQPGQEIGGAAPQTWPLETTTANINSGEATGPSMSAGCLGAGRRVSTRRERQLQPMCWGTLGIVLALFV